jgi:NTP pyrophosphatase (non-canonical NTP hydrolase)
MGDLSTEITELQDMQQEVMEFVKAKGWAKNSDEINFPEAIALLHSEASEALEAWRETGLDDYFLEGKPEGVGSEFADLLIRLLHYASVYGVDLAFHFRRKMDYNWTRPYRHGGKRA